MQDTTGEARTNSWVTFFYGPLHTDVQILDTGCSLEDLLEARDDRDEMREREMRERERERENHASSTTWWWWWWWWYVCAHVYACEQIYISRIYSCVYEYDWLGGWGGGYGKWTRRSFCFIHLLIALRYFC